MDAYRLKHNHRLSARSVAITGAILFTVMVVIGESQVRSSPNWPPPPRHELGGWVVDTPEILVWAAAINLPAGSPVLWAASTFNAISYLLDDHNAIIYLPWLLLVYGLWYFIGF